MYLKQLLNIMKNCIYFITGIRISYINSYDKIVTRVCRPDVLKF